MYNVNKQNELSRAYFLNPQSIATNTTQFLTRHHHRKKIGHQHHKKSHRHHHLKTVTIWGGNTRVRVKVVKVVKVRVKRGMRVRVRVKLRLNGRVTATAHSPPSPLPHLHSRWVGDLGSVQHVVRYRQSSAHVQLSEGHGEAVAVRGNLRGHVFGPTMSSSWCVRARARVCVCVCVCVCWGGAHPYTRAREHTSPHMRAYTHAKAHIPTNTRARTCSDSIAR